MLAVAGLTRLGVGAAGAGAPTRHQSPLAGPHCAGAG